MSRHIPYVIYKDDKGKERQADVFSMLLKERIIFVQGVVESEMADNIIAQLFYLEQDDADKPIHLYIDSPGGCVMSGLKIIDTMKLISPKVGTLATGLAASMGFALLTSGYPGMRKALPNAQLMAHRVSSGARGNIQDMEVSYAHSKYLDDLLAEIIADNVGLSVSKYLKAVDRDLWLTSKKALEFGTKGAIDEIVTGDKK